MRAPLRERAGRERERNLAFGGSDRVGLVRLPASRDRRGAPRTAGPVLRARPSAARRAARGPTGRSTKRPALGNRHGTPRRVNAASNRDDWAFVRNSTAIWSHGTPSTNASQHPWATAAASASSSAYARTVGAGGVGADRVDRRPFDAAPPAEHRLGDGDDLRASIGSCGRAPRPSPPGKRSREVGERRRVGARERVDRLRRRRRPHRGRCDRPSQARRRRSCNGVASWNSSTNTCRNRQRCAAANSGRRSIASAHQPSRSSKSNRCACVRFSLRSGRRRRRPRRAVGGVPAPGRDGRGRVAARAGPAAPWPTRSRPRGRRRAGAGRGRSCRASGRASAPCEASTVGASRLLFGRVAPQLGEGERVEGAGGDPFDPERSEPVDELACGLARERDREHVARLGVAVRVRRRDATREHARLPEPAGARIASGSAGVVTASRWRASSPSRRRSMSLRP